MNEAGRLKVVLDISIALSAEKDRNKLLNMIISKSMEITNCDAGTLYILDGENLRFRIMKTLSQNVDRGGDGEPIDIPPVKMTKTNICAYAAINKEVMNIPDVYDTDRFDFTGPKNYDAMTGYHTGSMMAVPLVDADSRVVGVLQLINALDDDGNIIPFDDENEEIVMALSSQAAIAISNMRYRDELQEQMWSFTEAMAAAIDERTPYNASHTRNVAKYCGLVADHINELHARGLEEESFSINRKEQLVMGALLHDIGKLVIPLSVMNKASRLGGRETEIKARLQSYALKAKIALLEGRLTSDEYATTNTSINDAIEVMETVNTAGFVNDELKERLDAVINLGITDEGKSGAILQDNEGDKAADGRMEPFFTEEEKECLRIVKGTLTEKERKIMESHVEITDRILSKVHFNSYFMDSPKWAAEHHECLNGRGYPNHKTADELATDARIIAVADICDALLATDRPYKKPIPKEKAFDILKDMANNGNIDGKIVEYLYDCIDC